MKRSTPAIGALIAIIVLTTFGAVALAQSAPPLINYQGKLTDPGGGALTGHTVEMSFSFLAGDTPNSTLLWTETHPAVTIAANGVCGVILGGLNPIPTSALAGATVFLEVRVDGQVLSPRQRLTSVPYAINAASLGGAARADFYSKAQVNALIQTLQNQIDGHEARLAGAELKLSPVTVGQSGDTVTDVYFTGVNLHLRSGAGASDAAVNGLGNLIVGYNENAQAFDRAGSHNLVVGKDHGYSSYGGLIAGQTNRTAAPFATVAGGQWNQAVGARSGVVGGYDNEAYAGWSTILGGEYNLIGNTIDPGVGESGVICGGAKNYVQGYAAGVIAGYQNAATNDYASVSGGRDNQANGFYSSVSGGSNGHANASSASVSGGSYNVADGAASNIGGGYNNHTSVQLTSIGGGSANRADGQYSSIVGGQYNTTVGPWTVISGGAYALAPGYNSCVVGGYNNIGSGNFSVVVGGGGLIAGQGNESFGALSVIVGGRGNLCGDQNRLDQNIGEASTICGGLTNNAAGLCSSVAGGSSRSVSGDYDWRAGTLFEDN